MMKDLIRKIIKEETTKPERMGVNSLKASQTFWDWLRYHEGDPKQKGEPLLKTYKDSKGVNTIGYGHTGEYAKAGNTITKEKANEILIKDVNNAAACVKRFLKEWKEQNVKGQYLKQNEYEALISLVFNSGCQGVRESDFIQKVKYGNYGEGAELIKKHKSVGLNNRRDAEYQLFKNGSYIKN